MARRALPGGRDSTPDLLVTNEESEQMAQSRDYQPEFWIFGSIKPDYMPTARELGYVGVGFWAADRDGDRIRYYFNSPTLQQVDWAEQVQASRSGTKFDYAGLDRQGDSLAAYATQAHANGLRVMVNLEGVNPYHWEAGREKWTPELLKGVVRDLRAEGADRWFTECVAGWPTLFLALAEGCRECGMEYQEGSDPSYLHGWGGDRAGSFVTLYPHSTPISIYHYHYRRDEMGKFASLAQEASLSFAFARAWGLPTALVYPVGVDWGEDPAHWEGILKATILIRALQFRTRDIMIIQEDEAKARALDVRGMTRWAQELVAENAQEARPLLNVVAHLRQGEGSHWREFATSGDAISCGAFHAGYDLIATTAPLPEADAYYVYTAGRDDHGTLDLTPEIAALFAGRKPVFLQVGGLLPTGPDATAHWRTALTACGVDPQAEAALAELPMAGAYRGVPVTCGGAYTAYTLTPLPQGTRLPPQAVTGEVLIAGEGTPLLVRGKGGCLVLHQAIGWQMMHPLSDLLAGAGVPATSDVWGTAGERVSAFLALHDTELDLILPRVADATRLRVRRWDKHHQPLSDEVISYAGRYRQAMQQFEFVLLEAH